MAGCPACFTQRLQAGQKLWLPASQQQTVDTADSVSAQYRSQSCGGMDEGSIKTNLPLLWGHNENHPNTDLSGARLQDKRGGSASGCVNANFKLKGQIAVLSAEIVACLQYD